MAEWMASDLSKLDLVAIQIDGLHIQEELILVGSEEAVRAAVARVIEQDQVRTRDLGGTATTMEFGDAVVRRIA